MTNIPPTNFASPLSGNETIRAFNSGSFGASGQDFYLTTGQIAALASFDTSFTATPITTAGNGVLTAAGLTGGEIVRSGPTGAFSDTTDTAVAIAATTGVLVGSSVKVYIKNTTAFTETLVAGVGVTLPTTVIIPAFSNGVYVMQIVSATAVTFLHLETVPISTGTVLTAPSLTALTTVGAGTILATSFTSGLTARSGATTAFTDTTDTAAAIIAASANLVNKIGTAFTYRYVNNTVAVSTITGGTGVTVSGITTVPANSWVDYLVTYTAAATLTMVGTAQGFFSSRGTFVALTGGGPVTVSNTAVTAGSIINVTLKTVGGTVGAIPNIVTITPGTGFTVDNTAGDTSTYNYEIRG